MKRERQFRKRKLLEHVLRRIFEQIKALHVKGKYVSLRSPTVQAYFSWGWVWEGQKIAPTQTRLFRLIKGRGCSVRWHRLAMKFITTRTEEACPEVILSTEK